MATAKKVKTVAKSRAKVVAKSGKGIKGKAKPAPSVKKTVAKTLSKFVKKAVKVVIAAKKSKKPTVKPKTAAKSGVKAIVKTKAKVSNKAIVKAKPALKTATKKVVTKAIVKTTLKSVPKIPSKVVNKQTTFKESVKVTLKATAKPVSRTVLKVDEPAVRRAPLSKAASRPARLGPLLTEAELIRQPKSEYMSKDQLNFFRHRLKELQTELRQNAGATTEHLRELAVAPDPADRATLEEEHALELRARDRERKLLKKVEGVLALIDSSEYGYCEETGEPIGIPRLLARPTATLTIEAQERRELKQKMYGE